MWSLRRALVVAFLVVVTIPLALFWLWPHTRALQNEVQQVQEKHLLLARNIGSSLDRYTRDVASTFDYMADGMLAERKIEAPGPLLMALRFRHICLVDLGTGVILTSIAGLSSPISGVIAPDKLQALKTLAATRNGLPGGVVSASDGAPVVPIVRAVGNRLVLAMVATDYVSELARSVSFGKGGHAIITDHTGRLLAHPLPAWEQERLDVSASPVVQRILRGETGVEIFNSPELNDDMIAGFTIVPRTGWGVMVPQPMSELTAAARRINTSAMSIISMGIILAALIALRFSLLVVNPLTDVMVGAARMARNERDVQINLPGRFVPREFTELAAVFNEMSLNISEARQQEAEARARAESANTQKTEFVRYITHELRSPASSILGFARILSAETLKPGVSPGCVESVRHIHDAATHLLSLINDLLDLGKIEAGQYTLNEVPLGIDELVDRCTTMLRETARARGITLTATMDEPPPELMADERALYQVLLNLVSNAIRYGHSGGSVDIHTGVREDGRIEIIVADDGPGIAPDDIERVMKPFERIERGAAGTTQGTGLGLPIVKLLVELHGGRFRLTSALGTGTVAYIELPACRLLRSASTAGDIAKAA